MAMSAVRRLRDRTVPLRPTADAPRTEAPFDPLGIDLQTRGLENAWRQRQQFGPIGPLPDPRWAGFFQALEDAGVDELVGGPSAPGSNQLTGIADPFSVDARGRVRALPSVTSSGTAGEALADVAESMSGQSGSMQALFKATRQRRAAEDAKAEAAAAQANAAQRATTPPPAPPAPPAPPPPDALARARFQATMVPGSLAALQRRTMLGE